MAQSLLVYIQMKNQLLPTVILKAAGKVKAILMIIHNLLILTMGIIL
jgi:hypothetical protein